MKLFGRLTFMSLAIMLIGSLGFLSPMMVGGTALGAEGFSLNAPVITLTEYTPTYNLGDKTEFTPTGKNKTYGYKLPKAVTDSSETVAPTATTSAGRKATVETDGTYYYLVTDNAGKYNITYTAKNGNYTTSTRNIVVEIVSNGATLELESNVAQIIPTIAYVGNKIVFPHANVKIDGEVNEEATKLVTVKLTDSDGTVKESFTQTDLTKYMEYTIADGDAGDFKVTYTYSAGGKNVSVAETFRVLEEKQDVELGYSNNVTSLLNNLSLEVGVEATLPTPVVVNTKANNVDVSSKTYTVITIKGPDDKTIDVTDYKFTPWAVGNYRISYVTKDFFGNTYDKASTERSDIKLSANSLEVKAVQDYNPEDESFDYSKLDLSDGEWVSHDYDVKSVYYITDGEGVKATFPAIIAKGGWGEYKNLKLTRVIYKGSSTRIGALEESHKIDSATTDKCDAYKTGSYYFDANDVGTYEIRYTACYVDNDGNEIANTTKYLGSYSFEIKKDAEPSTTNLKITAPSIPTSAVLKNADKTVTFNAPSVSDDEDKRLKVDVTYTLNTFEESDEPITITKNSDGTYSIKVAQGSIDETKWNNATSMTITFKVTNDLGASETVTKTIQLLDFSKDKLAPVIQEAGEADYDPTTRKVNLPKVTVQDQSENATNVSLVLYVLNEKGRVVDTKSGSSYSASKEAVMEQFEYEPTQEGTYTFVYVATDQNLNTTTFSTSCEVNFYLGYSVSINPISTQEYGNILDLPSMISVTKNGETVDIDNGNISIVNGEVTKEMVKDMYSNSMLIQVTGEYEIVQTGPNGVIKCLDGDISVKAWAKDNAGEAGICDFDNNCSSLVSFTSTDTTAPEFTIVGESDGSNLIASYKWGDSDEENTHSVPWFYEISEAGKGVDYDSLKVELTYTGSSTVFKTFTLADFDEAAELTFIATQQGKIKVSYTASDKAGNTTTRDFYIYIGDVLAPEIVVANDAITAPTKVGGECIISLDGISFKNDEGLSKTEDLKVVVKLNGTEIDWNYNDPDKKKSIVFTASEAGTYVITFDVTDKAGNEATTVTKNITVKSDSVNRASSSTVWGTIMIIVSLIVVGVVIYFFVKPNRAKTKANTNTKKTK